MKALEKDRARRYETATDFAHDIQRHLNHEAVTARPPSQLYRFQKLVRRNKTSFAAVAAVLLSLLIGLAVSIGQARRARRAERTATTEAVRSQKIVATLSRMLLSLSPEQAPVKSGNLPPIRDTTLLRGILDFASNEVDERLKSESDVQAQLRDILASTYRKLGLFSNAQHHAELALAFRERTEGTDDLRTLVSRFTMAMLHLEQNRPAQAEAMMRQVLETRQRLLGSEHRDTLEAMNGMAAVFSTQRRFTNAEALLRLAVPAGLRVAPDEPETWRAMNHLGVVRYRLNDLAEAESWFRRVLEVQQRVLGDDHPDTLASLNNLSGLYFALNNVPKAEEMVRRVVASELRIHGPEHQSTLRAQSNLANACFENGQTGEAETLARKALELQRKVLAPGHADTIRTMRVLANICKRQGKSNEVELLQREIDQLRSRPATLPSTNAPVAKPATATEGPAPATAPAAAPEPPARPAGASQPPSSADQLAAFAIFPKLKRAAALFDEGKYADAASLYREILQAQLKLVPETHEQVHRVKANLARCLAEQAWAEQAARGRPPSAAARSAGMGEALPAAGVGVAGASPSIPALRPEERAAGGPADIPALRPNRIADGPPSAAATNAPTRPDSPAAVSPFDPLRAGTARAPAELAREADRLLREVLADRVRGGNTNRWRLADATNRLGFALVAIAATDPAVSTEQRVVRFTEAEALLQPSGTYLIKSRTSDPPDRREALTRFMRLYEAWNAAVPGTGKAAELAKWREALAEFDRAANSKAPAAGPEKNAPNPVPQ